MKKANAVSKNKAISAFTIAIFVCTFVILTAIVTSYVNNFNKALLKENSEYLSEITKQISTNIEISISNIQKALEITGINIGAGVDDNAKSEYIKSIRDKFEFEYVGIADANGALVTNLETENNNINSEIYFQEAISGESGITYVPIKIFYDRVISGVLFSTPVYNLNNDKAKPEAVLVAMLDIKKLTENFQLSGFGGNGSTFIFNRDGDIVFQTQNASYSNLYSALESAELFNGFTIDKMQTDLDTGKSGSASYSTFGIEKFIHYQFLGIDDWYVASTIEKDAIIASSTNLLRQLTFIGIAIVILLPILIIIVMSAVQRSRNSLQEANTKNVFLANMSHEIRTPMNAIVGISELLLRENITHKQRNYVLNIVNAGNGLLTIINDILDLSKIEAGKFSIVEEEYELESLVYDITTITTLKIGDKPVNFFMDIDPNLPKYVIGDMIRVKQALLNIIGNAVKFTQKGFIKATMSCININSDELMITVAVTDTGCGIKKQDIDKLFVSFSQVNTHKNHAIEGTGLGLVITKHLCEMMGGGITVESEFGVGSTFTINFKHSQKKKEKILQPILKDNIRILLYAESKEVLDYCASCLNRLQLEYNIPGTLEDMQNMLSSHEYTHVLLDSKISKNILHKVNLMGETQIVTLLEPMEQAKVEAGTNSIMMPLFSLQLANVINNVAEHATLTKHGGFDTIAISPMPFVRVLVVDDNEVNLQVASGLLEPYHIEVHCALSGKNAIKMIEREDYDLVFMDHMMPDMDGVETVQCIRLLKNPQKAEVPIIALTANVTEEARELFVSTGFQDFLAKPIEMVKLNAILKKWLHLINDARAKEKPEMAEAFDLLIKQKEHQSIVDKVNEDFTFSSFVNFGAGVAKLGNEKTYASILETYCRSAREKLNSLPELLNTNLERFTIEIHGLKGASGGICAELIEHTSAELENMAIEKRVAEIERELPAFLESLKSTLSAIEVFLGQSTEPMVSKNTEQLKSGELSDDFLESLKEAFMNFDTETLKDIFEKQDSYIYDDREGNLIKKLERAYKNYDFDTPIILMEDYKKQLIEEESNRNDI